MYNCRKMSICYLLVIYHNIMDVSSYKTFVIGERWTAKCRISGTRAAVEDPRDFAHGKERVRCESWLDPKRNNKYTSVSSPSSSSSSSSGSTAGANKKTCQICLPKMTDWVIVIQEQWNGKWNFEKNIQPVCLYSGLPLRINLVTDLKNMQMAISVLIVTYCHNYDWDYLFSIQSGSNGLPQIILLPTIESIHHL